MYITPKRYELFRSLLKVILPLIFGAGAVGVLSVLPESAAEFDTHKEEALIALIVAAAPLVQNLWKTRDMDGNPLGAFLRFVHNPFYVVLLCASLSLNCATMRTSAETIDADGASFKFRQTAVAPPFGKLDEAVGTMDTGIASDGAYHLRTGQRATGVDNTGQIEVIRQLLLLAPILAPLLQQPSEPPAPAIEIVPTPAPTLRLTR